MTFLILIAVFIIAPTILGLFFNLSDKANQKEKTRIENNQALANKFKGQFLEKHSYKNGWALVRLSESIWSYVDANNNFINNDIFFSNEEFDSDTIVVYVKDKGCNLMNKDGQYLLSFQTNPKKSNHLKKIIEGVYVLSVKIDKGQSLISYEYYLVRKDGSYITNLPSVDEPEYQNGWFTITNIEAGGSTRINIKGELETPFFRYRKHLGDGMYLVSEGSFSYGLYDSKNQKFTLDTNCIIDYFEPAQICLCMKMIKDAVFSNGKCIVPRKFKQLVTDYTGKILIPECDWEIEIIDNSVMLLCTNSACGLALFNGKIILEPIFDKILVNSEEQLFFGFIKDTCFVYDSMANVISQYNWTNGSKKGFITFPWSESNKTFTWLKHNYPVFSHHGYGFHCRDLYIVINDDDGRKGVLDLHNNIVVPTMFDSIEAVNDSDNKPVAAMVEKSGLYGLYSLKGKELLPTKYVKIDYDLIYDLGGDVLRAYSDNINYVCYNLDGTLHKEITSEERLRNIENLINELKIETKKSETKIATQKYQERVVYLFFDTETTGLPNNYNAPASDTNNWPRLVQLSWVVADDYGSQIAKHNFIIYPSGYLIPPESTKVHGITTDYALTNGRPIDEVLDLFLKDLKQSTIIVGHNVAFDKKVVGAELIRLKKSNSIANKKTVCTMLSSIDECKIPGPYGYKYPTLQELHMHLFGHEFQDAHNSASDVDATIKCFWEMRRRGII